MGRLYNIGIIGAGTIAESHLGPASRMQNVRLAGVADIIAEKAAALAEKYSMKAYTCYAEMLEKEQLDIVIINLPHYLHKQCALDCARKGCHILLEKPMAMDEWECDEIIKACEEQRVKLMIGHIQRYFASNIKAKEVIRNGELGKLVSITNKRTGDYFKASRPGWFLRYETAGGGIAMNLGVHSLDIVQFLTDARIKSVRARIGRYALNAEVEGNAQVLAVLDNGLTACITLSGYKNVPQNETELLFTGGSLMLNGSSLRVGMDGKYEDVELQQIEPFAQQLSELIKSIESNTVPPISGDFGKSIVKAVKAIYESSERDIEVML